jgi:hypothetical protein
MVKEEENKVKKNDKKPEEKKGGVLGSNYNWWLNSKDDKYDEVYKELKE